jgi:hypothetical protein
LKNPTTRRSYSSGRAVRAVGPPAPRDQPEGGEREADEAEDDGQALDRRGSIEDDRPQRQQLGCDGRDPESDPEPGTVIPHGESAVRLRTAATERPGREIARNPFPRRPADHHELLGRAEARSYSNRGDSAEGRGSLLEDRMRAQE